MALEPSRAASPTPQLVVLPDAAHLATVEQPERVTAALATPRPTSTTTPTTSAAATGMETRRAVLGDAHVDRAIAGTTPFSAPLPGPHHPLRVGRGLDPARPRPRHPQRITLALLTALTKPEELAMHVRAARHNGLTAEQISEVLLQVAIYAGVPAANRAFKIAQQALDDPAAGNESSALHDGH